jgi:hypothetical protein
VIVEISCESLITSDAETAKGLLPVMSVREEVLLYLPAFQKNCFNRFYCGHRYSASAPAGTCS